MIQKGATIASGQESDDDLVWLADYVQTDNPSGERYYQARTHIRHPKASLSDAEIQKGRNRPGLLLLGRAMPSYMTTPRTEKSCKCSGRAWNPGR